jgi:hypothetical protein
MSQRSPLFGDTLVASMGTPPVRAMRSTADDGLSSDTARFSRFSVTSTKHLFARACHSGRVTRECVHVCVVAEVAR